MKKDSGNIILIGYSGHAFVVYSILQSTGKKVTGYCDSEEKSYNPFNLQYLGIESAHKSLIALQANDFFISIGDNHTRKKIFEKMAGLNYLPVNAIHASAVICSSAVISVNGVMISAGTVINPLVRINKGVIINTGAVIEHECLLGDFVHIGPGAVLCGNVTVGRNSFVGAGTVIRQGIHIGNDVMVGAGSVVVKDIPDHAIVKGCPAK